MTLALRGRSPVLSNLTLEQTTVQEDTSLGCAPPTASRRSTRQQMHHIYRSGPHRKDINCAAHTQSAAGQPSRPAASIWGVYPMQGRGGGETGPAKRACGVTRSRRGVPSPNVSGSPAPRFGGGWTGSWGHHRERGRAPSSRSRAPACQDRGNTASSQCSRGGYRCPAERLGIAATRIHASRAGQGSGCRRDDF